MLVILYNLSLYINASSLFWIDDISDKHNIYKVRYNSTYYTFVLKKGCSYNLYFNTVRHEVISYFNLSQTRYVICWVFMA